MVYHLERTDSKDRMGMLNDHDSVSSTETASASNCMRNEESNIPQVAVDQCSEISNTPKDSDSPPSSPSSYNLLRESSDQIKFTPPECIHLLIDRMNSSNSTTQFLKKNETDPSFSLSDEGDFTDIPFKCSPGVAMLLKTHDIGFIHWNWPRIRFICAIFFWSGMCAMLALAIGLIVTAPRSCEPTKNWWQGAVFYEIFPVAFQDTNHDDSGDIQGIITHLDYIKSLGATAIRLNAILETDFYPSHYWAILNHTKVASNLGTNQDFDDLIHHAHQKQLKVVIDFNPLYISKEHFFADPANFESNGRTGHRYFFIKDSNSSNPSIEKSLKLKDILMFNLSHGFIQNKIEDALEFWLSKNVDGIYLKYIEDLDVTSTTIHEAIIRWRSLIDKFSHKEQNRKSLICSGLFADKLKCKIPPASSAYILKQFDLVDYTIDIMPEKLENLPDQLHHQWKSIFGQVTPLNTITPWIMWSVGSSEKSRLASRVGTTRSFATTLIHLMLPGSVNLLYGDEASLEDEKFANNETLVPLKWSPNNETMTSAINITLLKNVLHLRNTSPPLLHTFIVKAGEEFIIPNYKIRFWKNNVLVLERFYPRWNSVVIIANLNQNKQQLDISSLFYQGKILISTHDKYDQYIKFSNVKLESGEVLITEI